MPNPITKVRPGANAIFAPDQIVRNRPALALSMLSVITYWSVLESMIAKTLMEVLGVKAKSVIEDFIQRASSTKQRELLQQHAGPMLTLDLRDCLEPLLIMFTLCLLQTTGRGVGSCMDFGHFT